MYFSILENSCICKDLINKNGVGNCIGVKPSQFNGDHFACYVVQPSNCTDLKKSGTNPGEKLSAKACLTLGIGSFLVIHYPIRIIRKLISLMCI